MDQTLVKIPKWVVPALLLAGLLIHGAGIWKISLNTDEVYFPLAAREGRLTEALANDVHPPLYPMLISVMVHLGLPESYWRMFSVLAWLAAAYLAYRVGREIAGEGTGLAAMALLMSSPQGLLLSRLVRSYSLAVFFAALAIYFFIHLLRTSCKVCASCYALFAALGCYTFYYNFYLLLIFLAAAWWLRRRGREAGWLALAASAFALGLFAPWLIYLAWHSSPLPGEGWIQWSAAPLQILRRFTQVQAAAGGLEGLEPALRAMAPSLAGAGATFITLILLIWGAVRLQSAAEFKNDRLGWTLFAISGGTALLALTAHLVFQSFVAIHYFAVISAAAAPLVAAPFAMARRRFAAGLLFGLFIVLNLIALPAMARQGREPLREASHWIDARLKPQDLVLGVAWFAADGYRWYGAGHRALGVPADLIAQGPAPRVQAGIARPEDMAALRFYLSDVQRVGLILSHITWKGIDRGADLVARTLQSEGFDRIDAMTWPLSEIQPSVRAEIWQRGRMRSPFAPIGGQ